MLRLITRTKFQCLENINLNESRKRCLHSSSLVLSSAGNNHTGGQFWERSLRGKYDQSKSKITLPPRSQRIREGLKELKKEIQIWKNEVVDAVQLDPVLTLPAPGEVDLVWKFDSSANFDNTWVVTADQDHDEGFSSASLSISPAGRGLFSGVLSTQVPKDGKIPRAGYCNMKSIRPMKSFKRETVFDWTEYTHIVLRVRGDGRSYMLNLATAGYFDVNWHDMYHFPLYTRGGPHWQISRIPFSKFFFSAKGRIQDRFHTIPLDGVTSFGITMADGIDGPYRLELDYVGLEFDPSHTEESAYETYKTPDFYDM